MINNLSPLTRISHTFSDSSHTLHDDLASQVGEASVACNTGLAHLRGKIIMQSVRAVRESVRNPGQESSF
jgi:hypothetical protein